MASEGSIGFYKTVSFAHSDSQRKVCSSLTNNKLLIRMLLTCLFDKIGCSRNVKLWVEVWSYNIKDKIQIHWFYHMCAVLHVYGIIDHRFWRYSKAFDQGFNQGSFKWLVETFFFFFLLTWFRFVLLYPSFHLHQSNNMAFKFNFTVRENSEHELAVWISNLTLTEWGSRPRGQWGKSTIRIESPWFEYWWTEGRIEPDSQPRVRYSCKMSIAK